MTIRYLPAYKLYWVTIGDIGVFNPSRTEAMSWVLQIFEDHRKGL